MKTSISLLLAVSAEHGSRAIAQTPSAAPIPPVPQPVGTSGSPTAPAPATTLPTTAPAPATTAPSTTPPPAATRTAANSVRLPAGEWRQAAHRGLPRSRSSRIRCRSGPTARSPFPLAGDLVAAGQTPAGLRDAITASLKDYVTNPVVTVIVVETETPTISVMGEVNEPGSRAAQRAHDRHRSARRGRRIQGFRKHQEHHYPPPDR